MSIVLIRTFLELLNMRNFNKAADRLCVTQSTVTMRIAALEQLLGQRLFTRYKSGVELTVAGRKFQPYAELVMQTWQHACQDLALPSNLSTMFKVGSDPELLEAIGGDWLAAIRGELPSVALRVDVSDPSLVLQRLAQGVLDAALLHEPRPRNGIKIERLFDDHLVLVSTVPRKAVRWHPAYVYVEWGEDFHNQHAVIMPAEITPPVSFTDGRWGLDFILHYGGSAYFPIRQIAHLVEHGRLFIVEKAGVMMRSVHFAYSETTADEGWFKTAREKLHALSVAQAERNSAFLDERALSVCRRATVQSTAADHAPDLVPAVDSGSRTLSRGSSETSKSSKGDPRAGAHVIVERYGPEHPNLRRSSPADRAGDQETCETNRRNDRRSCHD